MWRWRLCVLVLTLPSVTIRSQPISAVDNVRQIREVDAPEKECCPCPKADADGGRPLEASLPAARAPGLADDCPCRRRDADSTAAGSERAPSEMLASRDLVSSPQTKGAAKPLLHPEVDLASSVLETLREATDEEYQEALERDAARSAAKSRETIHTGEPPSEPITKNVVTIILNPNEITDEIDTDLAADDVNAKEIHDLHPADVSTETPDVSSTSIVTDNLRDNLQNSDDMTGQDNGFAASEIRESTDRPMLNDRLLKSATEHPEEKLDSDFNEPVNKLNVDQNDSTEINLNEHEKNDLEAKADGENSEQIIESPAPNIITWGSRQNSNDITEDNSARKESDLKKGILERLRNVPIVDINNKLRETNQRITNFIKTAIKPKTTVSIAPISEMFSNTKENISRDGNTLSEKSEAIDGDSDSVTRDIKLKKIVDNDNFMPTAKKTQVVRNDIMLNDEISSNNKEQNLQDTDVIIAPHESNIESINENKSSCKDCLTSKEDNNQDPMSTGASSRHVVLHNNGNLLTSDAKRMKNISNSELSFDNLENMSNKLLESSLKSNQNLELEENKHVKPLLVKDSNIEKLIMKPNPKITDLIVNDNVQRDNSEENNNDMIMDPITASSDQQILNVGTTEKVCITNNHMDDKFNLENSDMLEEASEPVATKIFTSAYPHVLQKQNRYEPQSLIKQENLREPNNPLDLNNVLRSNLKLPSVDEIRTRMRDIFNNANNNLINGLPSRSLMATAANTPTLSLNSFPTLSKLRNDWPRNRLASSSPLDINNVFGNNLKLPSVDDIQTRMKDVLNNANDNLLNIVSNNSPFAAASEPSGFLNLPSLRDNWSRSASPANVNFDIFRLKPISQKLALPNSLTSGLNMNSFRANLPSLEPLGIKPIRLESSLGKKGNLLGASVTFNPYKVNKKENLLSSKNKSTLRSSSSLNTGNQRSANLNSRMNINSNLNNNDKKVPLLRNPVTQLNKNTETFSKNVLDSLTQQSQSRLQQFLDERNKGLQGNKRSKPIDSHTKNTILDAFGRLEKSKTVQQPEYLITSRTPLENNIFNTKQIKTSITNPTVLPEKRIVQTKNKKGDLILRTKNGQNNLAPEKLLRSTLREVPQYENNVKKPILKPLITPPKTKTSIPKKSNTLVTPTKGLIKNYNIEKPGNLFNKKDIQKTTSRDNKHFRMDNNNAPKINTASKSKLPLLKSPSPSSSLRLMSPSIPQTQWQTRRAQDLQDASDTHAPVQILPSKLRSSLSQTSLPSIRNKECLHDDQLKEVNDQTIPLTGDENIITNKFPNSSKKVNILSAKSKIPNNQRSENPIITRLRQNMEINREKLLARKPSTNTGLFNSESDLDMDEAASESDPLVENNIDGNDSPITSALSQIEKSLVNRIKDIVKTTFARYEQNENLNDNIDEERKDIVQETPSIINTEVSEWGPNKAGNNIEIYNNGDDSVSAKLRVLPELSNSADMSKERNSNNEDNDEDTFNTNVVGNGKNIVNNKKSKTIIEVPSKSLFSKLRESLKRPAKITTDEVPIKNDLDQDGDVSSIGDMERAATEELPTSLCNSMQENTNYRCKMVCSRE